MSKVSTERVCARQEVKTYDVEVYVAFYKSGDVFVSAGIVGSSNPTFTPTGDEVRRYVFTIEAPTQTLKENP